MADAGSILIADDEDTSRESTCQLLRRAGFECDCAADADRALERLRARLYDLLLVDLRMPRNSDLQLVREARETDPHLPVIVMTGQPSAESAILSLEMAVSAYLTKPLDEDGLLACVRKSVMRSRRRQSVSTICQQLRLCLSELEGTESSGSACDDAANSPIAMTTVRRLAACLSDLVDVVAASDRRIGVKNLCELLDCSHSPVFRGAIVETVAVLKQTRSTFKSKTLADLRMKLEQLIGSGQGLCCDQQTGVATSPGTAGDGP